MKRSVWRRGNLRTGFSITALALGKILERQRKADIVVIRPEYVAEV
jgi:hypothetical protein